ncbi:phosphatases II [Dichomitus squalens]|uniref:phosphatidylinositol-3,4,5-trisphosphate 3-phosphatase n=1 Tax=Dichomitus squalens TaxID=114155 RepID=A0A4Q9PXA3_9APHY|nr:phosphatases II [Dichomitus squalens]
MGDYIRRLVSGKKARYKDSELDVELDLAYITDQVIVMGYPASGIEGLYRNRREDAKKFLEHRHGKNFWVFNFCPIKENSYPASFFDGRVSRYPFPDHHAPPLAILPLVAREIRLWLDGSPERVAVLHCKAGKGRSGTMACAYLLTLDVAPSAPSLERSATEIEKAKSRAEQVMNAVPADGDAAEVIGATTQQGEDLVKLELADEGSEDKSKFNAGDASRMDTTNSLSHVLDLHTSRRMKRPSSPSAKLKQGVSIPSQRRWLYYWSLILAHQAPLDFWSVDPAVLARPSPKVRLTQIRLRMRELGGFKANLVRAANALLDSAGKKIDAQSRSSSQVWASLARYDDDFVSTLERWEKHTRHESGTMGVRKPHADEMDGLALGDLFKDGRWDSNKMVRSFARMSTLKDEDIRKETSEEDGKIGSLLLRPLTGDKWRSIRTKIEEDSHAQQIHAQGAPACKGDENNADQGRTAGLETEDASLYDVTQTLKTDGGVVLDAHRELRVKLYLGQVFMGWFWFIPTFHMQHPRGAPGIQQATTLTLTRKELDFAVGIGSNIIDVAVSMEWCDEAANVVSPPERVTSTDIAEGRDDPKGVAAALTAIAAGETEDIANAKQAAED